MIPGPFLMRSFFSLHHHLLIYINEVGGPITNSSTGHLRDDDTHVHCLEGGEDSPTSTTVGPFQSAYVGNAYLRHIV